MNLSSVIICVILVLTLEPDGRDASPLQDKCIVHASKLSPREGESFTLKCYIGGPPLASINSPSSYEWVKDGKVIPGQTRQTLFLQKLSVQDEGDYQCGPPGSDCPRESYHLDVHRDAQSANEAFYVQRSGSPMMSRTLTLHCSRSGSFDVNLSIYVWIKNNEVISGKTGKTLTLQNLTKQDDGDYQCGDPGHHYPRRIHQVKVFSILPQPVIFKDKLSVLGRTSSLNCVIMESYTIHSNMVYTWYKGSIEIKGHSGPVLTFPNVTEADAGEYTCTVRDGPVETTSPSSPVYQLIPLVTPEVRIKPTNPDSVVKGILGDHLTLTCEVTKALPNVPADGYSWSYIPAIPGQPQHLPEKTSTLTVGPLTKLHSGQYQCQARNNQAYPKVTLIGRASVNLDVVYLENIHLTFDQEISEGDSVILTCSVESHPDAHLAWIVDGREVRHVVGQKDHYFIQSVTCSDSKSYTCRASNADMPGREKNLTTQVIVDCMKQPPTERPPYDNIQAGVSAPFAFSLPKQAAMVVVNPHGKDVISIYRNCSYVITPEFQPRVLQLYCDQASRHFIFTLSQVTADDEGTYLCREVGKQRQTIPNCKQKLVLQREESGVSESGTKMRLATGLAALALIIIIILLLKYRRKISRVLSQKWRSAQKYLYVSWRTHLTEQQVTERRQSLEKLYASGRVYIFPKLVLSEQPATASNEDEASETAPLLAPGHTASVEKAEHVVKDLVRHTLQQSTGHNTLPSFILHNTRLSKEENIILVLHRKLGVVVMIVKAVADVENLFFLKEAVQHLLETRKIIEGKLKRFVNTGMIKAAVALPNLSHTDSEVRNCLKVFCSNAVEFLLGRKKKDFLRWAERLSSRPDSQVWGLSTPGVNSPDLAFKMAASQLLSLAGAYPTEPLPQHLSASETWVLTPEQMEVRDSTARLLHIWGPPGSGKTTLLIHRARRWLAEGKAVVLAVGKEVYDVLLAHIVNAVRKGQNEEIQKKIRVCRAHSTLELALTELRGQHPNVEICLIVDTLREETLINNMLRALLSEKITAIWSVCRDNLQDIDADLSSEARKLSWETLHLPVCMRCTDNTVELLNQLQQGSSDHSPITAGSVPLTLDIPPWGVVDHCLHPDQTSSPSNCVHCKSELTQLQPVDRGLHWNHWIALSTGDPKVHTDIPFLCETLQSLGVPASFDEVYNTVASHGTLLDQAESKVAKWLEHVAAGVNEEGNPTVHVVRIHDIGGVEKEGVLLVHQDKRDNDPDCQSQEDRDTRLADHRRQWIRAVASSKGQVILLLLTPSPARSLLGHPEAVIQTN